MVPWIVFTATKCQSRTADHERLHDTMIPTDDREHEDERQPVWELVEAADSLIVDGDKIKLDPATRRWRVLFFP
jgi:hypothetical protein